MVKKYITMKDMQELTGLADSTLYDHVSKGVIPAPTKRKVRNGRTLNHWASADIIEAMESGTLRCKVAKPIVIKAKPKAKPEPRIEDPNSLFWNIGCFIVGLGCGAVIVSLL